MKSITPHLTPRAFALFLLLMALLQPGSPALGVEPGTPMDYAKLAIYPDRWEARQVDTTMHPWEGERVVLLTTTPDYDPKVMQRFIDRLDAGWATYENIAGQSPRKHRVFNNKPTIAAVPDGRLTCGLGCGYVGSTGIEVAAFYNRDYKMVKDKPDAFAHYYFYEMGRNFFVFGNRHSVYTTGFAVFMRYICMDKLECEDPEAAMRKKIEAVEAKIAASDISFLDAFTNAGTLTEKKPRLKKFDGPCDQPCVYASAMLKLQRDYGGEVFLKKLYRQLMTCPSYRADHAKGALRQSVNWLVAASIAAEADLTPVFVDRWRLPLSNQTREALAAIDWSEEGLTAKAVLGEIEISFK